jgi:CheY-like chemotaxis protein
LEIASKLLANQGCSMTRATDGQAAVDAFANVPVGFFDAVLMDIRMPVMDGLTATKTIRSRIGAMPRPCHHRHDSQRLRGGHGAIPASGMTAHLAKPVEPRRLYETLARLIR